jgi:RNAse (barnase) inhibitor barstar
MAYALTDMASIQFETKRVFDWNSFHYVSKEVFGFPDFYGNNLNAWIDCLTYLDDDDGMTNVVLKDGEMLQIEVIDSSAFKLRLPEIFDALVECTEFVNQRYFESQRKPRITLKHV